MYDIAIIGGSLSGLISAINLSKDYKVCIIDINQEIGFPTNFPGLCKNIQHVKTILSNEDQSNLYLQQNDIGWGLRSEWLIKYLTQLSAKNKVDILNRTRVSNIHFEEVFNIEIIGGGPLDKIIKSKLIIDESKQIHSGPGDKNHTISYLNKKIISIENQISNYFSGIIPTSKDSKFENSILKIERKDGLTEVWFDGKPDKNFNWIEIKTCDSPTNSNLLIIDDYFIRSQEISRQARSLLT